MKHRLIESCFVSESNERFDESIRRKKIGKYVRILAKTVAY